MATEREENTSDFDNFRLNWRTYCKDFLQVRLPPHRAAEIEQYYSLAVNTTGASRSQLRARRAFLRLKKKKKTREKQRRRLKSVKMLQDLKAICLTYRSDGIKLHQMWTEYVERTLNLSSKVQSTDPSNGISQGVCQKISQLDLHGALVQVVNSTQPSYVGVEGVVIRETRHTLAILTETNRLKVLAKRGARFRLKCGPYLITLYGLL